MRQSVGVQNSVQFGYQKGASRHTLPKFSLAKPVWPSEAPVRPEDACEATFAVEFPPRIGSSESHVSFRWIENVRPGTWLLPFGTILVALKKAKTVANLAFFRTWPAWVRKSLRGTTCAAQMVG